METFRSRVYTDRPSYADLDSPEKFQAIIGIIMTHLRHHPKAICSYSGGSDSDIMVDLIEQARKIVPSLPTGKYRFRPLYYVSDKDKAWYKEEFGIKYSDAYEVYGLTRTGCCGCPISYKAVDDLALIEKYEPNVVKAAWNIFGKSYLYRQKYNEYKKRRMNDEKEQASMIPGQMNIFDFIERADD